MTEAERLAEARRLCPDGYVVVPRKATSIMALRGAQARVGWYEPYPDYAAEYFKFDEKGESQLQDSLAPQGSHDDDEREYWLAACIWEGCIKGMEEWQRREEQEGRTSFIEGWDKPFLDGRRQLEVQR